MTIVAIGTMVAIGTIVAIGSIVAIETVVAIGHHWWHLVSLDISTCTSPSNGANSVIQMAPLITNGDRHWIQWWSSLVPMAMGVFHCRHYVHHHWRQWIAIGTIFVAIGKNPKSLWRLYLASQFTVLFNFPSPKEPGKSGFSSSFSWVPHAFFPFCS